MSFVGMSVKRSVMTFTIDPHLQDCQNVNAYLALNLQTVNYDQKL